MIVDERRLCRLDDIPDGGALAIDTSLVSGDVKLVLVRKGAQAWGYRNNCPHFSIRLDYHFGQFCTYRGSLLMCAHHSAMFRFEDGLCIDGPCRGASLQPIPLIVSGEYVTLDCAALPYESVSQDPSSKCDN